MKILMLVNWPVNKKNFNKSELQSSNFFDGKEYWFFKNILNQNDKIDVIGLETCPKISKFEYRFFKVYIFQTIKNLFKFNSYDVVISHGANSGIILAFIRRFFKTRYKHVLFDIGSFRSAEKGNGFVNKLIKFASKSIDYVFYHFLQYERCFLNCLNQYLINTHNHLLCQHQKILRHQQHKLNHF